MKWKKNPGYSQCYTPQKYTKSSAKKIKKICASKENKVSSLPQIFCVEYAEKKNTQKYINTGNSS